MSQALTSKWNLITLVLVLVSLSVTGCAPTPEATGVFTGSVKTGGEVCNNCLVSIADPDTLVRRGGKVDESGTFEVKGIPFGEYQVRVVQAPSNDPVNVFDERIPEKYRRMATSGLSVSITSTEPVVLDIDME